MPEVQYVRHKDSDYPYIATPELLARGDMLPCDPPAALPPVKEPKPAKDAKPVKAS